MPTLIGYLLMSNSDFLSEAEAEFANKHSVRYLHKSYSALQESYAHYNRYRLTDKEVELQHSIDSLGVALGFLQVAHGRDEACVQRVISRSDEIFGMLLGIDTKTNFKHLDDEFASFSASAKDCIMETEIGIWTMIASNFEKAKDQQWVNLYVMISLFIFFILFLVFVIYLYSSKNEANKKLEDSRKKLEELNQTLQKKVDDEVSKRIAIEEERVINRKIMIQQTKLAEMGQMIGAIAHQWKQPLNSISLISQSINDIIDDVEEFGLDEKTIRKYLANIDKQVQFMSNTIHSFRSLLIPTKTKTKFTPYEGITNIIEMFGWDFTKRGIEIEIEEVENFYISGVQNEFLQVILNILTNAKDAITERNVNEGKIRCAIHKKDDKGYITISDNAGGVPEELLPDKLFEAYISTKGDKGTGVGLQICKTIIEHNFEGKISVENIENGAVFTIELPIYDESTNS
jgi:signal transduction histidine kinase